MSQKSSVPQAVSFVSQVLQRDIRYFLHNTVIGSTCPAIWSALRLESQFLAPCGIG